MTQYQKEVITYSWQSFNFLFERHVTEVTTQELATKIKGYTSSEQAQECIKVLELHPQTKLFKKP